MEHGSRNMNEIRSILTFLWPYRGKIALSVVCAVIISILWSLNLSVTFPMVRVLFQGDTLQAYVDNEIVDLRGEIDDYSASLENLSPEQLPERARLQRKLTNASQALLFKEWLRTSVLSWVPQDRFQTIALILTLVIVATMIKGLTVYVQELIVGNVVHSCSNDIRKHAFDNIMELDYQSAQKIGASQLTSRLTNDITELSGGLAIFGARLVREPLKAICCISAAMWFNWRLTLLSIVVLPLLGVLFYWSGRKMRKAASQTMETMGNIYHSVSEALDASRVVISFSGEEHHREQLEQANTDYFRNSMKLISISALIRPVTELLGIVAFTIVLIPGAYLVLNNTNRIGGIQLAYGPLGIDELATLYVLLAGTLDPMRKLSGIFPTIKRSLAAAERIFVVEEVETLVPEPEAPAAVHPHSKRIAFEDVSFSYLGDGSGELPASLRGVNLEVPFGEVVAVLGGNGSGKSTLLSLLPRLMDPSNGSVRIDGIDVREMSLRDLRNQIGVVNQETYLFDQSILENIRYGNRDADRDTVEEYAKKAYAWDFIKDFPEGLDKRVGVGGNKLSGGQRQRLALARAMIREPQILILDEATSAIDAESEDLIHNVLKDFRKNRTVFIITHVLTESFLDLIDRIVVMDQGKIVATGTHETLFESSDLYRRLLQTDTQRRAA